jgi:hypothetical protein
MALRKWGSRACRRDQPPCGGRLWRRATAGMSVGVAIAIGAVIGLALGIVVSVTTDLPLAPEAGAVIGGLVGWLSSRNRA